MGFIGLLKSVILCLFPKSENYQSLFLQTFFPVPHFLSSSSRMSFTQMLDFLVLSLRLCSFFQCLFFVFFRLDNYYDSSSSCLRLSFLISNLSLSPAGEYFILVIVRFNPTVPTLLFLTCFTSLLRLIFLFISRVFALSFWSIFTITALKILCGNS